jgi:hypothetical protein
MHPLSTYALTGLAPVESNWVQASHLESGSTSAPDGLRGLVHPDNPLTWLAVVAAVTFGLVGVSGSVRLGKAKASASLDKA